MYGRAFWGDCEFLVIDTGGVLTVSKSQANVMEDLDITTTIGMDGIPLASREAAIARMPSMIERQVTAAVEDNCSIRSLSSAMPLKIWLDIWAKTATFRFSTSSGRPTWAGGNGIH